MIRIDEIYDNTFFAWLKSNRRGIRSFYCDPTDSISAKNIYCLGTDEVWEHNYITFFDVEPIQLDKYYNIFDTIKKDLAKDIHERAGVNRVGYIITSEFDSENVEQLCNIYGWEAKHYFFWGWAALDWYRGYDKTFLKTTPQERIITNGIITNINTETHSRQIDQFDECSRSLLYLVNESVREGRRHHLTEKIFKPICLCMPFILHSTCGSLAFLRRYGFETFDILWDESYDTEVDDQKRVKKITDLVSDVNRLSSVEKQALYIKSLPIIQHNYDHFYNSGFSQVLWKELTSMLDSINNINSLVH
jgi:hypothetical protein